MLSAPKPVTCDRLRALLRRLRDANLSMRNVALRAESTVSIAGCLSLDSPVEQMLGYRLCWPGGAEEVLWIGVAEGALSLALCDRTSGHMRARREIQLVSDERGRATSANWRARIDPSDAGPRDLERFLRRLVRGLFADVRAA